MPAAQVTAETFTIPIGSGFLVGTPNHHVILITASHVVYDDDGRGPLIEGLVYRLNRKGGKSVVLTNEYVSNFTKNSWVRSANDDIAFRFMAVLDDWSYVSSELFLPSDKLEAGAPLLVVGFPMGLRSTEYSRPIVRHAIVARADHDGILADGFVFPGNSGGPVIYEPGIHLSTTSFTTPILQGDWLVGMVTSYLPYRDIAISPQTHRVRVTFEENSGLFEIIPADRILKVFSTSAFLQYDR